MKRSLFPRNARPRLIAALVGLALLAGGGRALHADQPALDDYRSLKQSLERGYANLAWFGSPEGGVDLPALDRRTTRRLAEAATPEEARRILADFVEAFGDGHLDLLPVVQPAGEAAAAEPPRADLAGRDAAGACAALGYANRSQTSFSLPFESLAGFTLLADGDSTSFRAGILRDGGGATAFVRIRNFNPSQYPRECERAWAAASPAERADAERFAERVQDQWLVSLAATIDRVEAERPERLVVDVGSNSGGNESGDWSARLFTTRPLRSAPVLMAAGPPALLYLDQEIALLRTALAQRTDRRSQRVGRVALATLSARRASAAAAAAAPCDMRWVWRERRPWRGASCKRLVDVGFISGIVDYQPPGAVPDARVARRIYWPAAADPLRGRWTGPLYVLVNGATYSAAEMFAAALQNNRAARIVGTRSGGDGCGFMVEGVPVTLPVSHLRVLMPDCVRLRADGSNEVSGIAPDLPVPAQAGESLRARAARLLGAIAADRGSGGR